MQNLSIKGTSPNTRTVITIILFVLAFFVPIIGIVGIIVMWTWTSWPKWLKILITIPLTAFYTLILVSTLGVLSYLFLVRPFQVSGLGQAMSPNYNNGMYLMTKVVRTDNLIINRGDVIIFKYPKNLEVEYIKRIIGLSGETVMLKSGEVYINGQKLDETKYLSPGVQTYAGTFLTEGETLIIPMGQYFTLGDNRPHSSDSREWGFVPKENIMSTVMFCYWNCNNK